MPLSAGTRLGPYEILAPLGAGGMGEVYRARDGRLKREVALKILPSEVSGDPARRQRFEQEARAVAALNHPNIVAIYDVGEENGVFFIVTELVAGEPLRGMKPGLRKTLDYAVQIAGGMAAAHSAAVVHRDLKPDNILVTADGRIKILDFGLAKISQPRSAGDATETLAVKTDPGQVLGTVGYTAPEQIRGQASDHRADIFSFGLILYEMLSGRRAFRGETAVETMTAILKQETPELTEPVPSGVRQVVHHCLEKRAEDRFQSAQDLSFALQALSQSGSQTATAPILPAPASGRRWAVWGLAALLLVSAGAGTAFLLRTAPSAAAWTGTYLGGTEVALSPRPSPDGRTVAFIAFVGDFMQVGVLRPETGDRVILTRNTEAGYITRLSWSPDGTRIYYDRWTDVPRGIYSVPALGGEERPVLEDAGLPQALADGSLLFARYNSERQMQIFRFWPGNGRIQGFPLDISSVSYGTGMAAFPDGKEAIAAATLIGSGRDAGMHLYAFDLSSGATRRLPTGLTDESVLASVGVTRDGQSGLLFAPSAGGAGGSIVRIPRNGGGSPVRLFPLTSNVTSVDDGPDGSVFVDQLSRPLEILRYSPQGGHAERVGTFPVANAVDGLALLPDGRFVIPQLTAGHPRLMVAEPGKDPTPLVATDEETAQPVTAAGPGEVAFLIGRAPHRAIGVAAVSNGRITRRIDFNKGNILSLASSPDGKTLYCAADGAIWSVETAGGEPRKIRAGNAVAADPAGQYLLVEVVETPKIKLLRVPLHGGAEQEISQTGSLRPANVIGPNAIGKDGRIVMPLGSPSWYWPPGVIDPGSGKFTQIPIDYITDHHVMAWTPDGRVLSYGLGLRSTIWKFARERE